MLEDITPQKLKEEIDKGTSLMVVDLQESEKYHHSHVPGAVNISFEKFEEEYAGVLKDKALTIVLYGEFDELGKGKKAGEILIAAGYTQVGHIVGGVMGWKEAGFPTEGGTES